MDDIRDLTVSIIDDIIDLWEENKAPFRMVMISAKYCYICDKEKPLINDLRSRHTDDFSGYFNKYGWSYCKKCEYKVDIAERIYNNSKNYLMYSQTEFMRNKDLKFYRISSNPNITPYIQDKAYVLKSIGNSLMYENGRVYVPVSWDEPDGNYHKMIKLSNILFFNREYFHDSFKFEPKEKIGIKWLGYINSEYNHSNAWSIILNKLWKKNIPSGIIREIFYYWGEI